MTDTGTTKWYNAHKGIGFIRPDGSDEDVIVSFSTLHAAGLSTLAEGQRLEFDARMGNRGLEAFSIRLA